MSAATEELLLQIMQLESQIKEFQLQGKDASSLQEQLLFLRERFDSLNENLQKGDRVLKG